MTEPKKKIPYRYLAPYLTRSKKTGRWISMSELCAMDDKELKRFAARVEASVEEIKLAIQRAYPNGV